MKSHVTEVQDILEKWDQGLLYADEASMQLQALGRRIRVESIGAEVNLLFQEEQDIQVRIAEIRTAERMIYTQPKI